MITLRLVILVVACGLTIVATYALTGPTIDRNRETFSQRQLASMLPNPRERIVAAEAANVYLTYLHDQPTGTIYQHTLSNGYNGQIGFWIAVNPSGVVRSVRVFEHRETPGIGDMIEPSVSPWILQFEARDTDNIWRLDRNGGDFDNYTGATITARALVHGVAEALDARPRIGATSP